MKYIGKNSLSDILRVVLIIMMALTVVVVVLLPFVVDQYLSFIGVAGRRVKTILLIMLYPCSVLAFFVENELRRMFKTLKDRNPFVIENVKSLKRIGIFLFGMIAFFIFKIVTINSIMTMVGAAVFLLGALFCLVLADVFQQAVVYKEENDLTI